MFVLALLVSASLRPEAETNILLSWLLKRGKLPLEKIN
jgi:hypothetical protein